MIKVEIPGLLPKETNPNWRGHWAVKARATSFLRREAFYCARAVCYIRPDPRWVEAYVTVNFYIPDARHIRDRDNAIASLKPAIDGCVDAGILRDDKELNWGEILWVIDKDISPKIVLEFESERK